MRTCHDCGSPADWTAFPTRCKPRGRPDRCCDCTAEAPIEAERVARLAAWHSARPPRPARRRASYRAALRHRQGQAQLDLVDLLVPRP